MWFDGEWSLSSAWVCVWWMWCCHRILYVVGVLMVLVLLVLLLLLFIAVIIGAVIDLCNFDFKIIIIGMYTCLVAPWLSFAQQSIQNLWWTNKTSFVAFVMWLQMKYRYKKWWKEWWRLTRVMIDVCGWFGVWDFLDPFATPRSINVAKLVLTVVWSFHERFQISANERPIIFDFQPVKFFSVS